MEVLCLDKHYILVYSRVQRYFEIYLLSVRSYYGRKGIGKRLVEHSLQIAREKGYTIVKSDLGSSFSKKFCEECGFEVVMDTRYADDYKLYDKMDASAQQQHPTCTTMLKRI